MELDALMLSRIQFGLTAAFHYLYPPLSIGLGVVLVLLEGLWLRTGNPVWHDAARYWTKVFALTFAIGVATGLVMEFEFGTNWAAYSRFVGDVFGSALAAEGVFAFFLESGFLAVLLFGWDRVPRWLHYLSTCMVCGGAHFSAVWIVVANSWMHTPAGYHVVQGPNGMRAEITDFWAMVFNPSSMERLSHVIGGAWIAGAAVVLSVSAWWLLRRRHEAVAKASLSVALAVALVACTWQAVTGHWSAEGVAKNQPAKFAAMEGHFKTGPADLVVLGHPDAASQTTSAVIAIPGGASWLLTGDAKASVPGLDAYKPEDRPPVAPVFWSYRLMLGTALLMMAVVFVAAIQWTRGALWTSRFTLGLLVPAVLLPQIANQAGWFAAEVGRQPWIVQDLMRTKDAVSRTVSASEVWISLGMFTVIYIALFILFIYLLNEKVQHGPDQGDSAHGPLLRLGRAGA